MCPDPGIVPSLGVLAVCWRVIRATCAVVLEAAADCARGLGVGARVLGR